MTPLLVGVKEVAAALGVSPWVVRNFISSGLLAHVSLPSTKYRGEDNRRILVAVADLEAVVAKHRRVQR